LMAGSQGGVKVRVGVRVRVRVRIPDQRGYPTPCDREENDCTW
jgi:hypothetical protein